MEGTMTDKDMLMQDNMMGHRRNKKKKNTSKLAILHKVLKNNASWYRIAKLQIKEKKLHLNNTIFRKKISKNKSEILLV